MVDFRLQHVMRIWKAYASGVNFSYQETILLHTMRRQSFASILDSTFYNIWDLAIYSWKVWKPLQRVYDRDLVSFHQGIDGLLRRRLVVLLLTLLHLVCKWIDWEHNFRDLFTITSGTSSTSAIVHFCLSECGAGGGWVLVLSRQVDKWSSCWHWQPGVPPSFQRPLAADPGKNKSCSHTLTWDGERTMIKKEVETH